MSYVPITSIPMDKGLQAACEACGMLCLTPNRFTRGMEVWYGFDPEWELPEFYNAMLDELDRAGLRPLLGRSPDSDEYKCRVHTPGEVPTAFYGPTRVAAVAKAFQWAYEFKHLPKQEAPRA